MLGQMCYILGIVFIKFYALDKSSCEWIVLQHCPSLRETIIVMDLQKQLTNYRSFPRRFFFINFFRRIIRRGVAVPLGHFDFMKFLG